MTSSVNHVEVVEVGPRDGFQPIVPFISTAVKIRIIRDLHRAGLRRIEVGSVASPRAIPQLADGPEIAKAVADIPTLDAQFLVPTERHAELAIGAGARHLAFVVSASAAHNQSNVRRDPAESAAEFRRLVVARPRNVKLRLNIATAFDCPFNGPVPSETVIDLISSVVGVDADFELCLCDTTGRVTPDAVGRMFTAARAQFPQVSTWAFHGHDTYGLGLANVFAAWRAGVQVIDASVAGLGGCPFAPGATGNVATEDVVWMFETMDVRTGVDLNRLLATAAETVDLPGAESGGRVRDALRGRVTRAR
jgi:hydroxymethylglutaryl-CoA lyase